MTVTAAERETVINLNDADNLVHVWTMQAKHIRAFRKRAFVTETRSGFHDGSEWAEFTVPADKYSPVTGVAANRKPLTPEERERRARLLRANVPIPNRVHNMEPPEGVVTPTPGSSPSIEPDPETTPRGQVAL